MTSNQENAIAEDLRSLLLSVRARRHAAVELHGNAAVRNLRVLQAADPGDLYARRVLLWVEQATQCYKAGQYADAESSAIAAVVRKKSERHHAASFSSQYS